jgi:predicted metal-dependent phosphoesterase TrpH
VTSSFRHPVSCSTGINVFEPKLYVVIQENFSVRFSNIDLHCHSYVSDGTLSPKELVQRAHDKSVTTLSLTDHDTIAGLDEASEQAKELGIELIPGIEISCQWNKYGVHILAYNFALNCPVMQEVQDYQTRVRKKRAREICQRLQKKGLPPTYAVAESKSHTSIPGRPHFAQSLVELGAVADMGEAFKRYLGAGKAGDVKSGWPSLEQALEWIHEANAVAVIAHPRKYDFSLTKLRALIEDFKNLGGQGMEVVVSGQKPGEIGMLSDLCRRYGLYASVGSDFHSPDYRWAELGQIPSLPDSARPVWELWQ